MTRSVAVKFGNKKRYGKRIGLHAIFSDGRVPDKVAKGSETSYPYPSIRRWTGSGVGTQGRGYSDKVHTRPLGRWSQGRPAEQWENGQG